MGPLNVIVSFDGDAIGQKVGRATFTDDVEEVRRVDQGIQRGNEVFRSWALRHAGSVVELGGDEGRIEVPAAALAELPDIRRAYETAVGATVSVGVGRKLSESAKALLVAKRRGKDRVVLYDPGVESEFAAAAAEADAKPEAQKLSEEYLGKAVAHAKPAAPSRQHGEHSEGEVARNADTKPVVTETTHSGRDAVARAHRAASLQDSRDRATAARSSGDLAEMRGQVAAALNAMREQLPVMAQLKSAYPQTFKAVQSLVQSVISMGRALQQADTTLAKHERRPKVWSEGDGWSGGVKIPSADHPNRPAYDASYRDAVATQLANGDRKALRPVVVKVADLEGGNTLGVRNPARAKLYEKMLRAGDVVPPVVVRRTASGKWDLVDGTHRKAGALAAGRAELPGLELMTPTRKGELRETEPEASPPPAPPVLDKAALPTHAPERMVTPPVGTTHNGKIRVQHADGSTGWRGVRAGMIQGLEADAPMMGANSHPVSSREPGSK